MTQNANHEQTILLTMTDVHKSFPGVKALGRRELKREIPFRSRANG